MSEFFHIIYQENLTLEIVMVELFVFTALVAIVLFAFSSVLTKYLLISFGGPFRFYTTQLMFALPLLAFIAYFESDNIVTIDNYLDFKFQLIIFIISLLVFLGYVSLLNGFNSGNVSVGGIILSTRVMFAVPFAVIILDEVYPDIIYLFIVIGLFGSILVSWDEGFKLTDIFLLRAKGMRWFALSTIFWSMSNFLIRYLKGEIPPFTLIYFRQIWMIIFSILFYKQGKRWFDGEKTILQRNDKLLLLSYIVMITFAQAGFIYGLGKSLTITEGIGVAEGSITVIISLLIAKFWDNSILKEPLQKKVLTVRIFGALLAAIGTFGVIFHTL